MTSLESEYIVTPPIKIIASKLAANIILSDRMHRQIKLEGASTTVRKENDEGVTEFNVENPLLPSLHLVENRIIRLFKELKLTPKEGSKKEQSMDLQKILKKLNVVK